MPLAGAARKLGGCQSAKAAVRTHGVVVRPPCLDDPSCCCQRWEKVLVQALVAQATIKAFDEAVLLRLARRDVLPLDPSVLAPAQAFPTVIVDDVQHTKSPAAGQRVRARCRATSAGWFLAESPSVPACRAPACGRHACAPLAAPRDTAGTPSSGSCPCLHVVAGSPAVGSRTVDARSRSRASARGQHRPSRKAAHIATPTD